MFFDFYLVKRALPKIKAYRKRYLEREAVEVPDVSEITNLLFQEDHASHKISTASSEEEISEEMNAWITIIDEIIFAMRWQIEVRSLGIVHGDPKEIAFFKEYYGQYYDDRPFGQTYDAVQRAQRGFELFVKYRSFLKLAA
jgi:hypothetical protein